MKYNSVENAQVFLKEQMDWCLVNGHRDFSVWSNGVELQCIADDNDIASVFQRADAKNKGYWRAFQMVDGKQVSVLP